MNWFRKRKNKNKIQEVIDKLKKSKAENEYTFGTFEASSDSILITADNGEVFPSTLIFCKNDSEPNTAIQPICSFDLSTIRQDFKGKAYFLDAFREYGDYPTEKYYNAYCTDYILGYKVEDDQIVVLGPNELFCCSPSYAEFKDKHDKTFVESKTRNKNNSLLLNGIKQVGAKPFWVQSALIPNDPEALFIGQLNPNDFKLDGAYLYLFYSPLKKIFYQVEQYV